MIGTEFLQGQGMGNRLFCYITSRCIAADRGVPYGSAGQEYMGYNVFSLDLGECIEDVTKFTRYDEKEERLYLPNSAHDLVHGCYIAGVDANLLPPTGISDNTLLYGNLQAEQYFSAHKAEIKEWLRVKPEFDSDEYTADDLCILNVRGGEYADDRALFLQAKYWRDAMTHMKKENPAMRFMIITDDVEAANRLLPEVKAYHFTPEKDYVTVRNARYLIISNSSFAFFPAYTSDTVRKVIAPKYWARHNVSNGYWASEQNIYEEFHYLGRDGKLYSPEECRAELQQYRKPVTHPYAEDSTYVKFIRALREFQRLAGRAVSKIKRGMRK